jgi:UDP-N-acetylglucosamine 2-epimerase (non-hydrolysing)
LHCPQVEGGEAMKIATILGTRPEIIRLSLIMKKLDLIAERHIVIHTGQNFTYSLTDVFFDELKLRTPDYILNHKPLSLGRQLSVMYEELEKILQHEKPDKVLILGDTNSALSAILVERMGIPVIHMEAGNRCFDLMVPEEKNRKVVDAISSVNMPYTQISKLNLLKEGIPSNRIIVTGNPIYEVLQYYAESISGSTILEKLQLKSKSYYLVTAHRAENVDNHRHLKEIMSGLDAIARRFDYPVVCSIHPRTKSRIEQSPDLIMSDRVQFHEPFGFFDFVKLEQNALCAVTDSGTVQEECCIFGVPTVTIRNSTERPETIDCGSNIVSGVMADQMLEAVQVMSQLSTGWDCPEGYLEPDVSSKVVKFLLGGSKYVL